MTLLRQLFTVGSLGEAAARETAPAGFVAHAQPPLTRLFQRLSRRTPDPAKRKLIIRVRMWEPY